MKKLTLILLLCCSFLSLNCHRLVGSGHIIGEKRDIGHFQKLSLAIPAVCTITQGTEESLTIETDDNILREIITEVHGSVLEIRFRHQGMMNSIRPTRPIRCTLTAVSLKEADIEGSGNLECDKFQTEEMKLTVEGSGTVRFDTLTAADVDATISGSGSFNMGGTCGKEHISINGSGRYDGRDLHSKEVNIVINGSGRTYVDASDRLDVTINGSGEIRYSGSPEITRSINGSGSIKGIRSN